MFKHPFLFKGRIRRLEFGLSLLVYFIYCFLLAGATGLLGIVNDPDSIIRKIIVFLGLIPAIWFLWAQGAKRCHDRGNSGWYQFFPLYGLWMLFAEGDSEENEYGENPKTAEELTDPFAVEAIDSGKF